MRKRIGSMVLALCMIISLLLMVAMADGGSTVPVEPPLNEGVYEISTPEQLNWFAGLVNGTLDGTAQNTFAKGKLMADIVATNDFVPIGSGDPTTETGVDEGYKGVFDGGMHTVTLNINNPDKAAQGLFGIVGGGAEIKNVGVDGKVSGAYFTAGLVGMSKTTGTVKISNSWNNADVTTKNSTDTTKGQNAAGVFGCAAYHNAQVIIENCYNTGNISGRKESATITGWMGKNGKIINTYNTGSIQGNDSGVPFARYDSGNKTPVSNSYQLNTVGAQTVTGLASKTIDDFKSGQVAYLLNGSKSVEPLVWGQMIGINDYPVFHNGDNIVYYDETDGYYNLIENKISAKLAEVTVNSAKINVLGTIDSAIYYVANETPLTAEEIVNQATEIQKITLTAINGEISLTNLTAGKDYTYYLVKKISTEEYSNIVELKFATTIATLNKTSLTIEEGTTETLTYTVSPDGASGLTWSSSDEAVAIVNNDGLVTALSKGQTTIKITTAGGNLLASCEIKVEQVYEYVKITIDGIEGIDIKAYTGKSKIVEIPEIIDGLPVIQISNKTGSGSGAFSNKGLTKVTIPDTVIELWHSAFANSSLESIVLPDGIKYINWSAFENNKESFIIYGKPGISSKGAQFSPESYALEYGYMFKPTYNLNKTKLYTRIGKEESIEVKIGDQPAANESLIWSSNNESIATVDNTGKVTPLAIGRTQVKMATTDGKYESICQVIVVDQPTTEEESYYEISTAEDLDRFAQIVNSGTSNVQGKLMADIVANPGFEPIGFWDMDNLSARPYTGKFDGNGKTVTLNINNPASMGEGLFGLVGDGAVIENVNVDGSVTGGVSIGGIVGLSNAADDATVTISNCSNNATINANASRLGIGKNAAGILGNVLNNPNILIENCYNTGNIKGEKESAAIAGDLGIKGRIQNSHNVGNVQGNANGKTFAGYHANNSNPFTNSYQLDTVGIQEGIFKKTMEQFKSGELLDLLNGSESGQTPIWAQLIGIDDYPVFYNENMQVNISGQLVEATAKTAKIKVSGDPNSTVYYIVKDTPLTKEEIKAPATFIDENKKLTLNDL